MRSTVSANLRWRRDHCRPFFATVAKQWISTPLDNWYDIGSYDIGSYWARAFVVTSRRLSELRCAAGENGTAVGPKVAQRAARGGSEIEMNGGRADQPPVSRQRNSMEITLK